MTIIDHVTNLVEITQVTSTKSAKNARTFKNTWLAWCPKLDKLVTDNGLEFNSKEWEFMLMDWGIQTGRILSHTPAANAVVESSHHIIGQILCIILHGTTVRTKAELEAAFDDACAVTARVMCFQHFFTEKCSWDVGIWMRHECQCPRSFGHYGHLCQLTVTD